MSAPHSYWWRAARRRSASSIRPMPPPSRGSRSSPPSRPTRTPPILYPLALVAGSKNPDTASLAAYLRGAAARAALEAQGFTVLAKPGERAPGLLAGRAGRDPAIVAGRVLGDADQPAGRDCRRAGSGTRPVLGEVAAERGRAS